MIVRYVRDLESISKDDIATIDKTSCDKIIEVIGESITLDDVIDLKEGDAFVVETINTLGFNSVKNLELIKELYNRGVKVDIKNFGVINGERLHYLEVLLDYEKECMVERLRNAKHIAKQNNKNFVDGRPRIYNDDVYDYIIKLLNEGNTYDEIRKLTVVSKATISRIKKRYEQKNKVKWRLL